MVVIACLIKLSNSNDSTRSVLNKSDLSFTDISILNDKKGKPYFINFTAAWCITCKVNENTTLNKRSVKDFFKKNDITYIEIDWTNRNANITNILANYNRSGVPLYIFWTPGIDSPKVLPAILNEGMILQLID